ncbi:MAG: VCBS repeat-containing protein [Planctomycetota bacterium]
MKTPALALVLQSLAAAVVFGTQSPVAGAQVGPTPWTSEQHSGQDQAHFAWGDFDGDELVDVYVSSPDGRDRLMRNLGDGTFEDALKQAGLTDAPGSRSAAWEDLDSDGDLDLYVLGGGGSRLYRNSGSGTFDDVTGESGIWHRGEGCMAVWEDCDGDALSDLCVLTGDGWRTYRNMGRLRFERAEFLAEALAFSGRQVWGDYDSDEALDVYVISPIGQDRLFRNARNGSFQDVTEQAQLSGVTDTTEARWIDFDADGDLDLQLVSQGRTSRLLRNPGNGVFDDVTIRFGLDHVEHVTQVIWFDYNGDGFPDPRFVTPFGDHLFHNAGGTALEPVPLAPVAGPAGAHEPSQRNSAAVRTVPAAPVDSHDEPQDGAIPKTPADHSTPARHSPPPDVHSGPHRELLEVPPHRAEAPDCGAGAGGGFIGDVTRSVSGDVSVNGDLFVYPDSGIGIWCEGPIQALGSLIARAPAYLPPIIIDNDNTNRVEDLNADMIDGLHASATPAVGELYPLSENLNVSPEGNVGIGTTTPAAKLDVVGHISASGNVAVGGTVDGIDVSEHAADASAHHVRYTDDEAWDAILARGGEGSGLDADLVDGWELSNSDGSSPNVGRAEVNWDILTNVPAGFADGVDHTGDDADWQLTGNDMYAIPSGNVGIGTTNPTSKLHVVGNTTLAGNTTVAGDLAVAGVVAGNLTVNGDIRTINGYDIESDDDVEVEDDLFMLNSGSRVYFQYYDDVWLEKDGTGSTVKIDGEAGGVGNLHVTGKITSDGGYDPPYVLYDAETRTAIIERVDREVPDDKRGGAVLFWNGQTLRFEVYLPARGEFRDLLGNVLPGSISDSISERAQ